MTTATPPPANPDPPSAAVAEQQLAGLLDDALRAESATPGASADIVQGAPAPLQPALEQLLDAGLTLRDMSPRLASTSRLSSSRARDLRARIMRRIDRS